MATSSSPPLMGHKPSFKRASSTLDINDQEFEWLKAYLIRDPSTVSALVAEADALPSLEEEAPRKSKRGGHDDGSAPPLLTSHSRVLDDPEVMDDDDCGNAGKKRRKIGWTNTEDLAILAAVRRIGTQWPRIAAQLPGRTADAVRNRWHRLQKGHALGDSEEGRSALDGLLLASGVDPEWVPPELPLPDASPPAGESNIVSAGPDEPCIRGSDHGRAMWTAEEDRIIEEGVAKFGCKWRQIAAKLPGRSDSSVRNRWMRLCKDKTAGRLAAGSGGAIPVATLVKGASEEAATPVPMKLRQRSSLSAEEWSDDALAQAVDALGVEELPLGLELPDELVDLDRFVEAVSGVLRDDGLPEADVLTSFAVDEAAPHRR